MENKSKGMCQEEVIQHLIELFSNVLHFEIIQSVACNTGFDLEKSTNILLELSNNVTSRKQLPKKKKVTEREQASPKQFAALKSKRVPALADKASGGFVHLNGKSLVPSPVKKSKKELEIERIIELVAEGYKVVIILRGLPGSGKSYLAKKILNSALPNAGHKNFIFSADNYFYKNGVYVYDASQLPEAHTRSQILAANAMRRGASPIIIDNTNTQMWEMKPYVTVAVEQGYIIEILEPSTPWAFNDKELAHRNQHGVPRVKIKDMLQRYEKNITPLKVMAAYSLNYGNKKPPLFRTFPPVVKSNQRNSAPRKKKMMPHLNPFHNERGSLNNENVPFNLKTADNNEDILKSKEGAVGFFKYDNTGSSSVDRLLFCNTEENNAQVLEPDILNWNSPYLENQENGNTEPPLYFSDDDMSDETGGLRTEDVFDLQDLKSENYKNWSPEWDLNAWGVTEKALRSWDICTPLDEHPKLLGVFEEPATPEIEMIDSETNTCVDDFALVGNLGCHNNIQYKVLHTYCREINEGAFNSNCLPRKKIMCDKSSLANENNELPDRRQHMELLKSVFPSIPVSYLREIYDRCKGDINWTVDLLAEDNKHALAALDNFAVFNAGTDVEGESFEIVEDTKDRTQDMEVCAEDSVASKKSKNKNNSSEEQGELKKAIEKLVDIGKSFYSEHVLKIKQSRHGITDKYEQPSTSKVDPCEYYNVGRSNKTSITSDVDIDECETDGDANSDSSAEELVELNFGQTFINELEDNFGDTSLEYPKGFQPVVQLPVGLARQLYALYIESVYKQMDAQNQVLDALIKEDEAFAKKLQEQEQNENESSHSQIQSVTENLTEIMDEQYAHRLYQKDVDQWKNLTPDDLAAKLTKQKLFESFPAVDQNILVEIWQAHGNNYQDTVESILASDPDLAHNPKENITEPPLTEGTIEEMKEAHEHSQQSTQQLEQNKSAVSYREDAAKYLEKRSELYQKAQQAYQKGMTEVALFYSELAKNQTHFYDRANGMAATAFLNEHADRLQNYDTLDLHFLYVKEAVSALDMFIDNSIHLLKGTNKIHNLFVITGRGKRSENGISRIKPAVKRRLKTRKIRYRELNPGLLEIRVHETTLITNDL